MDSAPRAAATPLPSAALRAKSEAHSRQAFRFLGEGASGRVHALDDRRVTKEGPDIRTLQREALASAQLQDAFGCARAPRDECCRRFAVARLQGRTLILEPRGLDLNRAVANMHTSAENITCGAGRRPPLLWEEMRSVFADIVAAVRCLHKRGFFHGDVKPANVIVYCASDVAAPGSQFAAVLTDLEQLHRVANNEPQEIPGVFTPEYSSRWRAFMGFGRPFSEDTLATLLTIDRTLQNWVRRALLQSDAAREVAELRNFFRPLADGDRPDDLDPSVLEELHRWLRRSTSALPNALRTVQRDSGRPPQPLTPESSPVPQRLATEFCPGKKRPPVTRRASVELLDAQAHVLRPFFGAQEPPHCTPCPRTTFLQGRCVRDTNLRHFNNCKYALLPPAMPDADNPAYGTLCDVWNTVDRDPAWQEQQARRLQFH
jgi:serine/threonine protein kinase